MTHRLGMIRSHDDNRDKLYPHPLLAMNRPTFPLVLNLQNHFSPVRDQGQAGTCALEAAAAILEFGKPKPVVKQSVLFPYYNVRVMEGTVGEDSGAEPRDVFKSLIKDGDCANKYWGYYLKRLSMKPSFKAYANSKIPSITSYHAIYTADDIKMILNNILPVYIGMAVYDSFEGEDVARSGIMTMPKPEENLQGYHAVVIGGYDDLKRWWIVRNSWGTKWGKHGYFFMPYDYMIDKYVSEKWAITV